MKASRPCASIAPASRTRPGKHGIARALPYLALMAALALGGCLDMGLARSVAFPPDIPGLDGTQPWVRLPVDSWVTDGSIQPVAIAACFTANCSPPAAVGLFRAGGGEAETLARIVDDPDRLARAVTGGTPRPRAASRPRPPVTTRAERIREGSWRGFLLHMARQDGSVGAHGAVLARMTGGETAVLMVVTRAEDAALRIARAVVGGQD